jgi:hypothetical protein
MADRHGLGAAQKPIEMRLNRLQSEIKKLLNSPALPFDERIFSALPASAGIYRIFDPAKPAETVRAGRTNTAKGGLRQRVYGNHLMGSQKGNLRAQLVRGRVPGVFDLPMAKAYIRAHLAVQVLVVQDKAERVRLEHFMLAVLEPQYCD